MHQNLKISEKGKEILRNSDLVKSLLLAIITNGNNLSSEEGLVVKHNGEELTFRSATSTNVN